MNENLSIDNVSEQTSVEDLIIALTNRERSQRGTDQVTKNDKLSKAAGDYAELMRQLDKQGHRVGGQTVPIRLDRVGYIRRGWGENVAWNKKGDAQNVMRQWMNSDDHRMNLLKEKWKEIGVGLAGPSRLGRYYYCQIFGIPADKINEEGVELMEDSSMIYCIGLDEE